MKTLYENLLSSQALLDFFGLKDKDEAPKELFFVLDRIKMRNFKAGEKIIQEGDKADSLYIIDKGQADVISESSGGIIIGQLKEKDFFGEVALLTGKTRTATVVAKTDMVTFQLFREDVDQVIKNYPHIIGTLFQKLYERLKVSYLSLEERNEQLQKMSKIRTELASLFSSVVLMITCYTFILGLLNNDLLIQYLPEQSSYFFSRIIEVSTLVLVFRIVRNSSLSWKDFGLNTIGVKNLLLNLW